MIRQQFLGTLILLLAAGWQATIALATEPNQSVSTVSGLGAAPSNFELEQRILHLEERLRQQEQRDLLKPGGSEKSISETVSPAAYELAPDSLAGPGGTVVNEDRTVRAPQWKEDGYLWFESQNKSFTMHIGGRTQVDAVFLQAPQNVVDGLGAVPGVRDAVDFRRARFRMEGRVYETMEYTMEYDFINAFNLNATTPIEEVAPLDLWWGFRDVPLFQYVRIGNQKEGLGMERIQSSRWLEFMERSFNNDAAYSPYSNGFSPGLSMLAFTEDQKWSFNTGVFKNTTNPWQFGVSDGAYASTTRITWLPIYDEASDGAQLLHFGSSVSIRGQDNDALRQRVRGPLRNGPASFIPAYLNTGTNRAGTQTIFNLEMASVWGPLQVSGEYYWSWTQDVVTPGGNDLGEYRTQGGYVQALYFLTGEHRAWDRRNNVFTRVTPYENAFLVHNPHGDWFGAWGAWQIGARYQYQNFPQFSNTTGGANAFGGELHGADVVLNWYLNPNTHMVFDYSYVHRNAPGTAFDGPVNGFGMRFAYDF